MSSKLRHIFILANILWVVIIFILCAMPSDDIPDPHWNIPHLDKVVASQFFQPKRGCMGFGRRCFRRHRRLSVLSYCKKIHPHEKLNSILNFNFQFLILN